MCAYVHVHLLHISIWVPPFSVGNPLCLVSTSLSSVYRPLSTPLPLLFTLPLFFFNEMRSRSSVPFARKQFFAGAPAIFHLAFLFCWLNDIVCRASAWVGSKVLWGSVSALGARRASFLTRAPPVTF